MNMKLEQNLDVTQLTAFVIPKQIDYTTEDMFQGRKTLVIEHRGEEYLLRVTRNNKLILTK